MSISPTSSQSKAITFDPGYGNTGSCRARSPSSTARRGFSAIAATRSSRWRSLPSFAEVCFLLIYGQLPTQRQYDDFRPELALHTLIHEDMKKFFEGYSTTAHPMTILSSMVAGLSTYYPGVDSDQT